MYPVLPNKKTEVTDIKGAIWKVFLTRKELHNHYVLTTMAEVLYDPTLEIVHGDGEKYHLPQLDSVFEGEDFGRWFRLYRKPNADDTNSKHKVDRLLRLQIIALYLSIVAPEESRTFMEA